MVPIPGYLKYYAALKKVKSDTAAVFSMKCSCGSEFFDFFANHLTQDEKKAEKPYYDVINQLTGPFREYDENGKMYVVWHMADGKSVRWEDLQQLKPWFSGIDVLKAECPICGKEIILFDSRTCGYDGVTEEHTEDCMAYLPHFKRKSNSPVKIEITIENDPSFEAFKEASGLDCTEDFYSNAFSWIQIHGISEEGKRKKLFDSETA